MDSYPAFPANDLYYPAARLTERVLIVDGVQIERFGATDLLTGFTIRVTSRFDNGQSVTMTRPFRIRDIKLNPDFAKDDPFRITSPVLDGALVSVYDEPNIVYEWRDGKIVKKTDQGALGKLFGNRSPVK